MAQDHEKDDAPDAEQPAEAQAGQDQGGTHSPLANGSALPNKASEDEPRGWGDREDDDHDAWLKEQKPPHWG